MDQQNFYYGKHSAELNYQTTFGNSGSEYQQSTGVGEHPSLHHSTGLNFNSSSTVADATAAPNNACSDLSNVPTTVANLTRSTNNNLTANPSTNEYNAGYSRYYSYISDNTVQNVSSSSSSSSSNPSDCNNTVYGSAFSSKTYENSTNSAHVPVIAVTSNSSHTRNYHSNLNYGSYSADYNHKTLGQNYHTAGSIMPSPTGQNRSALNASTAFTPMDHGKSRMNSNNANDSSKTSGKTSVIKPLNAYNASASANTPINYTKFVQPYAIYANNNKTVSTLEKSPSSTNRGMYLNSSTNHKNAELYCPEPISAARYSNSAYAINVSTPGTGHTNSHYLTANSYPLNYGHTHYLAQHQNTVTHHTRNFLPSSAYQTSLDESVASNYYQRQNGLVVRPTPSSTYKQGQIAYQNPYNYGRNNITATGVSANHSNNSHATTLPKPQTQKSLDESYSSGSLTLDFDSAYDRRNLRPYNTMYGSNYMDPTGFDEYTQYPGFPSAHSTSMPFYSPKASSKHLLYNHNPGLNVYNNNAAAAAAHAQLPSQTSQSVSTSSSSVATTTTTTIVQQPVPINPSSSQLISSNYDATSMHANSILPSQLFNNNNKEFCQSSNPYHHQQNPYTSQILLSRLQNGSYYPNQTAHLAMHSNDMHIIPDKMSAEKSALQTSSTKYIPVIDLEEQINSSKISKVSGMLSSNATLHHRVNEFGQKVPVLNVHDNQRQRKDSGSSQNTIESNKSTYGYNSESSYSNDCYRMQYQWKKTTPPSLSSTATVSPTASSSSSATTPHMHPKKQSIRDYLSTWNEDEDGEIDATSKKPSNNQNMYLASREPPHLVNNKMTRTDKSNRINENVPVIVQPMLQSPHNLYSALTYPGVPIPNAPAKIQVDISIDNDSQNLPDIIVDIPKPKEAGEGECFERANGK